MIGTSARLLHLLSLLHSRRFWTGGELARALGVTERSVRRDVDRLRELGYPVHATAGVGGGYRLGAGKDLPPLPLDDDEAVAVAIGLRVAATGPAAGVEAAAVRALSKLERVLPQRLRRRIQALQAVSVRLGEPDGTLDASTLVAVADACGAETVLRFAYRDRAGAVSQREVEPYRVVHTSHRWYLVAWDRARRDWRTFRVDRMARPQPGARFAPRPLPSEDLAAWVSQRVSTEAYRHRAVVTIAAPAAEVARRLSPVAVRVEPAGEGTCRVHTGADSLEVLAFHLGYLGFDFEVHEPPELREHLRVLAQRLARAAEAPPGSP